MAILLDSMEKPFIKNSKSTSVSLLEASKMQTLSAIDHILSLEEHFLVVFPKQELQNEHMKKVTFCTPSKSFAGKDVPCTANNIQKIPDMNNSQEVSSLEHQADSETHPWRCKQ